MTGIRPRPAGAGLRSPRAPALAALVVAVLLVAVGCSSAPPPVVGEAPVVAPAPQIEPDPTQLRIGVDDLGVGFNPHRVADLTPTSRATASLVLPSAFRTGADGTPQLDSTVVTSARVTATVPFTVSYEIAPAATWSDNAPIAAEDFVYLWEQMRSQPGVVGSAGYRAITDVRSRAGGKAVDVVFARPYPGWNRLFDDLLPAHLLKDAPGAWGGALTDSIPVSGGPYAIRVVDRIRGQVTLARNDRYWATAGVSDEIVLQAADHASLIDRVRTGDVQATQFRGDGADLAALRDGPPGVVVRSVPEPATVSLALRSDDGPLADVRVRRAVVAALDRDALVSAGADGGPSEGLRADAFATAPSEPGYSSTLTADSPARGRDPATTADLLSSAGYVRDAEGRWSHDGVPLTLRLAAPPQVAPFGRLIRPLADELRAAGIDSVVVADAGANPFPPGRGPIPSTTASAGPAPSPVNAPGAPPVPTTTPTTTSPSATATTTSVPPIPDSASDLAVADISVQTLPIGGDPLADLDSTIGCPARRAPATSGTGPPAPVTSTAAPTSTTPAPPGALASTSVAPTSTTPPTTTTPPTSTLTVPRASGTGTPAASTSSSPGDDDDLATPQASEALTPTGFCDPSIQSVLDAASAGSMTRDTALALVEPALWSAVPLVPLFQATTVLVSPAARTDVVVGPLGASPLASAGRWAPPPRLARANGDSN